MQRTLRNSTFSSVKSLNWTTWPACCWFTPRACCTSLKWVYCRWIPPPPIHKEVDLQAGCVPNSHPERFYFASWKTSSDIQTGALWRYRTLANKYSETDPCKLSPSARLEKSKVVFLVHNPHGRLFQQWSYKVSVTRWSVAGSARAKRSFFLPSAEGDRRGSDDSGARGGGERRKSSLHGSVSAAGTGKN